MTNDDTAKRVMRDISWILDQFCADTDTSMRYELNLLENLRDRLQVQFEELDQDEQEAEAAEYEFYSLLNANDRILKMFLKRLSSDFIEGPQGDIPIFWRYLGNLGNLFLLKFR